MCPEFARDRARGVGHRGAEHLGWRARNQTVGVAENADCPNRVAGVIEDRRCDARLAEDRLITLPSPTILAYLIEFAAQRLGGQRAAGEARPRIREQIVDGP